MSSECFQSFTTPKGKIPEAVDTIVIHRSVVVNTIKPRTVKTFAEYSTPSFLPYIQCQLSHAKRIDVVWDEYIANSRRVPGGACNQLTKYHESGSNS